MYWKREYETGNDEIDMQHRSLIERINDYKKNISAAQSNKENILKTLLFLVNYTNYHFEAEEKFMVSIKYPKLEEHKIIHQNIVQSLRGKINSFKEGESNINLEFYYFLSSWINVHILDEDMKIKEYCKKNKIKEKHFEIKFNSIDSSFDYIKSELLTIKSINDSDDQAIVHEDVKFRRIIFLEEYFEKVLNSIPYPKLLELLLKLNSYKIVTAEELNIICIHIDIDKQYKSDSDAKKYSSELAEIKNIISL